jgi:hypothetical protein
MALIKEREERQISINRRFSLLAARNKLSRHYEEVNSDPTQQPENELPLTDAATVADFRLNTNP